MKNTINHVLIFPKKSLKFIDNKWNESVESQVWFCHERKNNEKIWIKKLDKTTFIKKRKNPSKLSTIIECYTANLIYITNTKSICEHKNSIKVDTGKLNLDREHQFLEVEDFNDFILF